MSNFTTPVTRTLNKEFRGRCPRIQAGAFGSFLFVRIEDPEGAVPVKLAEEVSRRAATLFAAVGAEIRPDPQNGRVGHTMGGVVANWFRG